MKIIALVILFFSVLKTAAQPPGYSDSLQLFIQKYVAGHEVVKGADRDLLHFFSAATEYRVKALFTKTKNADWFMMPASGKVAQQYRVYGTVSFTLFNTQLQLNVYQSKALMDIKEYADYLFIPFTDKTTGLSTYGGGRYMDVRFADIGGDYVILDFNKAYNPYCAYASGYNCPIPPPENDLPVAIEAGEKSFGGH